MLSLLFALSAFTLWTTLLTVVLIFAQRRNPTLLPWPAFYWWLLLLATVPLWPLWHWPVTVQLPNTLWLDAFSVQSGAKVHAGQQIGAVGASGFATGPHLHFELLQKGQQLDPTHKLQLSP